MTKPVAYDLLWGAVSFAALLAYQWFLHYRLRHNPRYSLAAANTHARAAWVESIMETQNHILAVQTLRNSTFGSAG